MTDTRYRIETVGVRAHDLLQNAPRGYCLVMATVRPAMEDGSDPLLHIQSEANPYTGGKFKHWSQVDPVTNLEEKPFVPPRDLVALADALKALFDTLPAYEFNRHTVRYASV